MPGTRSSRDLSKVDHAGRDSPDRACGDVFSGNGRCTVGASHSKRASRLNGMTWSGGSAASVRTRGDGHHRLSLIRALRRSGSCVVVNATIVGRPTLPTPQLLPLAIHDFPGKFAACPQVRSPWQAPSTCVEPDARQPAVTLKGHLCVITCRCCFISDSWSHQWGI